MKIVLSPREDFSNHANPKQTACETWKPSNPRNLREIIKRISHPRAACRCTKPVCVVMLLAS